MPDSALSGFFPACEFAVVEKASSVPIEREIRKVTILASVAEDYSRMPASRVRRGLGRLEADWKQAGSRQEGWAS